MPGCEIFFLLALARSSDHIGSVIGYIHFWRKLYAKVESVKIRDLSVRFDRRKYTADLFVSDVHIRKHADLVLTDGEAILLSETAHWHLMGMCAPKSLVETVQKEWPDSPLTIFRIFSGAETMDEARADLRARYRLFQNALALLDCNFRPEIIGEAVFRPCVNANIPVQFKHWGDFKRLNADKWRHYAATGESDLNLIVQSWCVVEKASKVPDNAVDHAFEWYLRAISAAWSRDFPETILNGIVCLEALFGDGKPRLSQRLALAVATFVGGDHLSRSATFKFIKGCYHIRSEIVHGRRISEDIAARVFDEFSFSQSWGLGVLHVSANQLLNFLNIILFKRTLLRSGAGVGRCW